MAAAGTVTKKRYTSADGYMVEFAWTSDASGDVAEGGTTGKGVFTANGYFVGIEWEPGTASDNYDVTLLDDEDIDVLRGLGANQQQTGDQTYDTKYRTDAPRDVDGAWQYFFNKNLTLTVANGGNAATGTIRFKFSRAI